MVLTLNTPRPWGKLVRRSDTFIFELVKSVNQKKKTVRVCSYGCGKKIGEKLHSLSTGIRFHVVKRHIVKRKNYFELSPLK